MKLATWAFVACSTILLAPHAHAGDGPEPIRLGSDLHFLLGDGARVSFLDQGNGALEIFAQATHRGTGEIRSVSRTLSFPPQPGQSLFGEVVALEVEVDSSRTQIQSYREVCKAAVFLVGPNRYAWILGGKAPDGSRFVQYDLTALGGPAACLPIRGPLHFGPELASVTFLLLDTTPNEKVIQLDGLTDRLAILDHQTRTYKASSADPGGFNADGFPYANGAFPVRQVGASRNVLMEDFGPGVINSIFFQPPISTPALSALYQSLEIFIDDDLNPLYGFAAASEIYSNQNPPFVIPFSDFGHGGFWSLYPLEYSNYASLIAGLPTFNHIVYTKGNYRPDAVAMRAVLDDGANGNYPHAVPQQRLQSATQNVSLPPQSTGAVMILQGAGVVLSSTFEVQNPDRDWSDVRIRIRWDGDPVPSVEGPLGMFLGATETIYPITSIVFQTDLTTATPNSRRTSYYPLPFRSEMRVELENRSANPIDLDMEFGFLPGRYPEPFGHFTMTYDEQRPVTQFDDYEVAHLQGYGKLVGSVLETTIDDSLGHDVDCWEGDQRIFVDQGSHPTHHNTGTEDHTNWGFWGQLNFDQEFSYPTHAYSGPDVFPPAPRFPRGVRRSSVRNRLFFDPVPYYSELLVNQEHGPANGGIADYSSAAFTYHRRDAILSPLTTLELGDPASRLLHDYTSTQPGGPITTSSWHADETRQTSFPTTKNGLSEQGPVSFRVRGLGPAQRGLLLRAEIDRYSDDSWSKMRVEVDGHVIGWLNSPWQSFPAIYRNSLVRFVELELEIPYCLTAGRTQIDVCLIPEPLDNGNPSIWRAFRYHVFEYRP